MRGGAGMRGKIVRYGAIAVMSSLVVLGGASGGTAGPAVCEVPVFAGTQILFSASGFSALPIFVPGFGTLSSVIIRPVIIVRPTVIIAPTRVVVLSPSVTAAVPFFPAVPIMLPSAPALVNFSRSPALDEESLGNVLRAPELFDHRLIGVTGPLTQVQHFVDAAGNEETLLQMQGDWNTLNVLARGRVDAREGTAVRAAGVFYSTGDLMAIPMQNVMAALVVTAP
jgi:hypothetical protein